MESLLGIIYLIGLITFFLMFLLPFLGKLFSNSKEKNKSNGEAQNIFALIFLGLILIGIFKDGCN
jgi:hypothetical membrane protein